MSSTVCGRCGEQFENPLLRRVHQQKCGVAVLSCAPVPVPQPPGRQVSLLGLSDDSLNGLKGTVGCWSESDHSYTVLLNGGGDAMMLPPQNLRIEDCGTPPNRRNDEHILAMLRDLCTAYSEHQFQAELKRIQESQEYVQLLGPAVAVAQYPVLARHSFEPSAEGMQQMKQAVAHAIIRGDEAIREAADRACALLGLRSLVPRASGGLLAQLWQKHQETERWSSGLSLQAKRTLCTPDCKSGSEEEGYCEQLLKDGHSAAVVKVYGTYATLGLPVQLWKCAYPHQRGVARIHQPTEAQMMQFVMRNEPVIITGAVEPALFTPMKLFNDLAHLRALCGHRCVKVKSQSAEGLNGSSVFLSDPELEMPFEDYLTMADNQEGKACPYYLGKVPLRKFLPEMHEELDTCEQDPRKIFGGCMGALTEDGIYTYFGCGQNTSTVHYDPYENLVVCVCGEKRFQLYPPSDTMCMYPVGLPGISNSAIPACVEHTAELKQKYTMLENTHPVDAIITAGEMLYLPICWWHGVSAGADRNMILNYWFDMHSAKKTSYRLSTDSLQ